MHAMMVFKMEAKAVQLHKEWVGVCFHGRIRGGLGERVVEFISQNVTSFPEFFKRHMAVLKNPGWG